MNLKPRVVNNCMIEVNENKDESEMHASSENDREKRVHPKTCQGSMQEEGRGINILRERRVDSGNETMRHDEGQRL